MPRLKRKIPASSPVSSSSALVTVDVPRERVCGLLPEHASKLDREPEPVKAEPKKKELEIPDDVLRNICRMAQAPLPSALGHGGVAIGPGEEVSGGKVMGQGTLVTMMRVSKLSYTIAGPILYNEIITDDLESLLSYTKLEQPRPSPGGLRSKRQLLGSSRHLHIKCPRNLMLPVSSSSTGAADSASQDDSADSAPSAPRARTLDLVRTIESFVLSGGLHTLFPSLESMSICAYTTPSKDLAQSERITAQRRKRIERAWTSLFASSGAPFHCEPLTKLIPFQVARRVTFTNRKKTVKRYGRKVPAESTRYIHVQGPPMGSTPWPLGLNHKTVFLYSPPADKVPMDAPLLFKHIEGEAKGITDTVILERKKDHPDRCVDIEVRIPRAALPLFYAFTCPAAIDPLVDTFLEEVKGYYVERGDKDGYKKDKWAVKIMEGMKECECPVCLCSFHPDAARLWELERVQGVRMFEDIWMEQT